MAADPGLREEAVEQMARAAWDESGQPDLYGLPPWEQIVATSKEYEHLLAERRAEASCALTALLALLDARGWKIVPVNSVPHTAMRKAGGDLVGWDMADETFRLMCAASPNPLTEAPGNDR